MVRSIFDLAFSDQSMLRLQFTPDNYEQTPLNLLWTCVFESNVAFEGKACGTSFSTAQTIGLRTMLEHHSNLLRTSNIFKNRFQQLEVLSKFNVMACGFSFRTAQTLGLWIMLVHHSKPPAISLYIS